MIAWGNSQILDPFDGIQDEELAKGRPADIDREAACPLAAKKLFGLFRRKALNHEEIITPRVIIVKYRLN